MSRPHRPSRSDSRRTAILLAVVAVVVVVVIGVAAAIASGLMMTGPPPPSQAGAFTPGLASPRSAVPAASQQVGKPPAGWAVVRSDASGAPLVATALVHPTARDESTFVGAAWMSPSALRFTLVPGTEQPGGRWVTQGEVPPKLRSSLVAAFNSGFKYKDLTGGFEAEGRVARRLLDGQASLVIGSDGTATIDAWGRDPGPGGEVVAVRQNMRLIVDAGQTASGLLTSHDPSWGPWGKEKWQTEHTSRSALGQLKDGSLVYVAGPDMDLQQLADALVAVHAVRGMELDIHANMETFHIFGPGHGTRPGASHELLSLMTAGPDRYLVPDKRDFVTATLR